MSAVFLSSNQLPIQTDPEDLPLLSRLKWHGQRTDVRKETRYFTAQVEAGRIFLNHLVMGTASQPDLEGLHVDGDPSNVTKANLAWVMRSVVAHRTLKPKRTPGAPAFRGVVSVPGAYVARIRVDGIVHHLGRFSAPADAARAYDRAAREHFGPFALVNFPNEDDPRPEGLAKLQAHPIVSVDGQPLAVSPDDLPVLCRHRWKRGEFGYSTVISGVEVHLHELVLGARHGFLAAPLYLNGDRTDHRKENLKWVAQPGGLGQVDDSGVSSSHRREFVGVKRIRSGKFEARIGHKTIGYFESPIAAAKAYDAAAQVAFGERAILNFP